MKIVTILGTRPEIIRLARVIPKLDALCEHRLVHTGQNFEHALSDLFLRELGVRTPDHFLGVRGHTFAEQIAQIIVASERVLTMEKPDRLMLLGDTNSALAAIVAKRLGIPVFHLEAGNRCYDDRVPEEVNRRIVDHSTDVWMPYTERSRQNLLREGMPGDRVFVIGNPINEIIRHFDPQVCASRVLATLGLQVQGYLIATLHRAENVDIEHRLRGFVEAFERLHREHHVPVVVSTHPRTTQKLEKWGVSARSPGVRFLEPFGFFDFVALERSAMCVLTDSGTVQEECAILRVPNVTLRDVTERPETIEGGSNILSGGDPDSVSNCVRVALSAKVDWGIPREYLLDNVSDTVVKIMLGYLHQRSASLR